MEEGFFKERGSLLRIIVSFKMRLCNEPNLLSYKNSLNCGMAQRELKDQYNS